jgi:ABC-type phosphate transport system substrate-binding protein
MKNLIFGIIVTGSLVSNFSGNVKAQEIHIEGAKFIHPIVEKWVTEYKKEYPEAGFEVKIVVEKNAQNPGLTVVAGRVDDDEVSEKERIIYAGRYALIPVSNKNNPLIGKVGKGLKKKELKKLLFEKDLLEDEDYEEEKQEKYAATVYSRSGESPTTLALAEHFSQCPTRLKGKRIVGDEIYLLNALQKDENGIAYNTLNYVYDLGTRRLKPHLAVLPLNLKSEQREALTSLDIDRTISVLENSGIETIPVEKFGFVIPEEYANSAEVLKFAGWILERGQQFNHELGFLTLDAGTLAAQKKQLAGKNLLSWVDRK